MTLKDVVNHRRPHAPTSVLSEYRNLPDFGRAWAFPRFGLRRTGASQDGLRTARSSRLLCFALISRVVEGQEGCADFQRVKLPPDVSNENLRTHPALRLSLNAWLYLHE